METIKGKVERISQKEKGYGIYIDGNWYNGWGQCPYKKNQEVEFEYEEKDGFRNIKQPSKVEKTIEKTIEPKFNEIIKYLAMPHVTISVEKTIQESQFEPKKIAIHMKTPVDKLDSNTLSELINLAETEIHRKCEEMLNKKYQKKVEEADGLR